MQTPHNDEVQHCGKESTLMPCRALTIDMDLDSEVFENLDPPARVHTIPPTLPIVPCSAACSKVPLKQTILAFQTAMQGTNPVLEAPTASTIMQTPHISPISTDAQEQQSEPAASSSPQTSTHQPQDFSESGPATTIHEADPPAESVVMSSRMPQQQLWRHNANAPTLPPSPMVEPQSAMGLINVPENLYGSDLEVPAPRDNTKSDQDEKASLEDEFCPVSDDRGEDEDMEHGRRTSTSGAGIGPVPFMQMLQSFHYENFNNLHLQYLELVHDRYKSCPKQFWVCKQALGSFSDQNGYARFVPSAGYLHHFYDMIIEWQSMEMKQCIAMLPVGSAPLFTALHTVVNEYSEIWSMLFTMMKGHDQYMPNLHEISESLVKFGHPEVQAVFTDNVCADKNELEQVFPSLLKDVVPILPHIAFNMEWPVNLETGIHGPVALIQVAYQHTVYLIKTAPFLENASEEPFAGHVELRPMAKERSATVKRTVHLQLVGMDIAQPVVATTPSGTAIALLAPDRQEVAHGIVALKHPPALNGVDVSLKQVVMTVSKVLMPSFLLPAYLQKAKQAKSLASFSSTPFSIVANIQNLHICPSTHDKGSDGPSSGLCTETLGNHQDPKSGVLDAGYIDSSNPLTSTLVLNENECDGDSETSPELTIEGSLQDLAAEAALVGVMEPYMNVAARNDSIICSHVLYDNFHCYNQFPIAHHHGLRWPFARVLSAAFFIPVVEDKSAMEAVLKDFGTTYNAQLLSKPEWVLSHVQCHVPSPEILLPCVADIIRTYGPIKDATMGQPLFNDHAWEIAKHIMENVQLGYYLDPADVDLYFEIRKDQHGLMLYRCCRGTNSVEGGVHQNLIQCYTSFNTLPHHAINVLLNYTVCHNMMLQVGNMNHTGKAYVGHFNVPLKNHISRLLTLTMDALVPASSNFWCGWVNGNDYELTHETFGMIQFVVTSRRRT
ncbi:hypothetical protein EDB19DRAFT_1829328 [Suillus lakei]|nr:hypothetical protein EDB19DRAFT_1829328 [Suillus lakei]